MADPVTQYVKTPGGYVAYQVFGEGPIDIVFITNWCTNLDVMWEEPSLARYFNRLATLGRVICFDKRGTGVSDPVPLSRLPTLEEWMDDAREVMDTVESKQAVVIGDTEGGFMAMLYAASHPDRVSELILVNAFPRFTRADDYQIGLRKSFMPTFLQHFEDNWGTGEFLLLTAPSVATDSRFRNWFARYQRLALPPGASRTLYEWVSELDIRPVLPSISVPTLVLQRQTNRIYRAAHGRYLAQNIPRAKYVKLPGGDCFPFHAGDTEPLLTEIQEFLTGMRGCPRTDRVLATIMLTDIVDSTRTAAQLGDQRWRDTLEAHNALIRKQIERFRGQHTRFTGDGFIATFDGPARAISCANSINTDVTGLGLQVRTGIHTGEIELRTTDIGGIAVHIAARVMAIAEPGEVLVSRTVKDLVAGSGFGFTERGVHSLKGVPDEWHLFTVSDCSRV